MRGVFYTNNNGYYSVKTIIPGVYQPRPEHFHIHIWINNFNVLTTQLYFQNYVINPVNINNAWNGFRSLYLTLNNVCFYIII